ncbi:MAG: PulJ/GspJ family protein [Pirellulaceae bacterium]
MKTSPQRRGGWSLMEMMVVITLMTVVLSMSAMLLTALMRSQGMLWADLHEQSARTRLAVQLRTDAHWASSASCASPQVCVFLLTEGDKVEYEIKGNSLHRVRRKADVVSERETFSLQGLSADFSVDESRQRPLVRLNLVAAPEFRKYSRIARPSILEAAVGIGNPPPAGRSQP